MNTKDFVIGNMTMLIIICFLALYFQITGKMDWTNPQYAQLEEAR